MRSTKPKMFRNFKAIKPLAKKRKTKLFDWLIYCFYISKIWGKIFYWTNHPMFTKYTHNCIARYWKLQCNASHLSKLCLDLIKWIHKTDIHDVLVKKDIFIGHWSVNGQLDMWRNYEWSKWVVSLSSHLEWSVRVGS